MARTKERNISEEVLKRCCRYSKQTSLPKTEKEWEDEFCDLGVAIDCLQIMQQSLLVNKYSKGDWKSWGDSFNSNLYYYFLKKRKKDLAEFIQELTLNQKEE